MCRGATSDIISTIDFFLSVLCECEVQGSIRYVRRRAGRPLSFRLLITTSPQRLKVLSWKMAGLHGLCCLIFLQTSVFGLLQLHVTSTAPKSLVLHQTKRLSMEINLIVPQGERWQALPLEDTFPKRSSQ